MYDIMHSNNSLIENKTRSNVNHILTIENILANNEENQAEIYPIDFTQVRSLQRRDRTLRHIMANEPDGHYKRETFEQRSIIFFKNRIYIRKSLRVLAIR